MLSKIAFFLSLNIACFTLTQHANAAGNDGTDPPIEKCAPLVTIDKALKQANREYVLDGYSHGFEYKQNKDIIVSLEWVIEDSGEKEHAGGRSFIKEKLTTRVCDYWRNNETVALAALSASKKNIDFISDNLKENNARVVEEIIRKQIPMELNLENNIHITAATQRISDKGMGSYMHTIKHAKNITPKQKFEFQLALIRHYSEADDIGAIVLDLSLSEEEYKYLFNHIDQKTLFTIVKYRASFFEFVAPEKQTLPMAVRVIEWDKNMYEHMSENLRNNSIIKKMKNCHEKWFWRFWKTEACFEEIKEDYTSQLTIIE